MGIRTELLCLGIECTNDHRSLKPVKEMSHITFFHRQKDHIKILNTEDKKCTGSKLQMANWLIDPSIHTSDIKLACYLLPQDIILGDNIVYQIE